VRVQQPELHGINREGKELESQLQIYGRDFADRRVIVCCGKLRLSAAFPTLFVLKRKAFKHTVVINRTFTPSSVHRLRYLHLLITHNICVIIVCVFR